jgi:hypothetical protein
MEQHKEAPQPGEPYRRDEATQGGQPQPKMKWPQKITARPAAIEEIQPQISQSGKTSTKEGIATREQKDRKEETALQSIAIIHFRKDFVPRISRITRMGPGLLFVYPCHP